MDMEDRACIRGLGKSDNEEEGVERERVEKREKREKGKNRRRGTSIYMLCQLVEYYVSGKPIVMCYSLYHIHCPQRTYSKSHEGKRVRYLESWLIMIFRAGHSKGASRH